jgi:hypothetical protein
VSGVVNVSIHSHDFPLRRDADSVGARVSTSCASSRRIERSEGAVPSPQERVTHEVYVIIPSRDHSFRVDTGRKDEELGTRDIERYQGAVAVPQEAVRHGVCVIIISRGVSLSRPRTAALAWFSTDDGADAIHFFEAGHRVFSGIPQ